MSDGKEVKRWFIRCFLRNGIEFADIEGPLTHSKIEVMPVADHDRIMAEKDEKLNRASQTIQRLEGQFYKDEETIAELRAEGEALKTTVENNRLDHEWPIVKQLADAETTIARQARVIEIAKRVLYNAGLRPPDGGTPTVETICEDLNDAIKEIAAIERAEGEKE